MPGLEPGIHIDGPLGETYERLVAGNVIVDGRDKPCHDRNKVRKFYRFAANRSTWLVSLALSLAAFGA